MKKIIVLTSTLPKSYNDKVPAFVRDQIKNLKLQYNDLEFYILVPWYSDFLEIEKQYEYNEIRYHYFWPRKYEKLVGRGIIPSIKENRFRIILIPFYIFFQFINLVYLTKKLKPSLIYAHWFTPQAITASIVSVLFRVPFVFTTHAQDAIILKKIPIFGKLVTNFVVKRAKAWTSDSIKTEENLKSIVDKKFYKFEKKLVIPMPINDTEYQITQPDKFIEINNSKNKYILCIGRFAEKKGIHFLLDIYKELIKENKNLYLIISGDGPLKKNYFKQINELHLDKKNIIFTGYVNKAQKKYLFQLSDIFIAPSIQTKGGDVEGLPVVILESLYFGKVTVASLQSNAGEIISDGVNGFLIDPTNIKQSSEKINNILKLNKFELKKIEENAKILSSSFSDKYLTEKYYEHLIRPFI